MSTELSFDPATLLRQQESLRFIIESISEELELQPLLTRIVRHACDLLQADRGTIGLVDESRQVVRTEAMVGMPSDEMGAEMAPGVGLAGAVYQSRQPVILNRYGNVANPMLPAMSEDAVIGLPIFWRERMIGFFGIGANPPRHFTQADLETLTLYARQLRLRTRGSLKRKSGARRVLQRWCVSGNGWRLTSTSTTSLAQR